MQMNYAGWTLDLTWSANRDGLLYRTHQRLWNLAWLMHPELDQYAGRHYVPGVVLPDAQLLLDAMDRTTWEKLGESPDAFMHHFVCVDDGSMLMTQHLPAGYRDSMMLRSAQAYRRMYPVMPENVVVVDFKNRRVCASA